MILNQKFRIFLLILGDFIIFYFSLIFSLALRYFSFQKEIFFSALRFFLPLSFFWILVFYWGKIYDLTLLKNRITYYNRVFFLCLINIGLAIIYFYVLYPGYQPKIVLLLLAIFTYIFINLFHLLAYQFFKTKTIETVIISKDPHYQKIISEIKDYLLMNPQIGYKIIKVIAPEDLCSFLKEISLRSCLLVINLSEVQSIPKIELINYQTIDLLEFYEMIFKKIPIEAISLEWIFKNITNKNWDLFEASKRIFDLIGALLILCFSLPLWPIIALIIKIDSDGPIFYKSLRTGKSGKIFLIYKFRTMIKDAHLKGPFWTIENDPRITRIGKFLRKTHLDEIPQLINIIKGEMSFIGPRPEEEKLVQLYKEKIPFYQYRFLIKPGIIGWAQINYPHTASLEEVKEKLGYDFFYLKNRNFLLDLLIFFRVFISIFEIKTH